MRIAPADLGREDVRALLAAHLDDMHAHSPACSIHALPIEALGADHVSAWTAHDEAGNLLGIGALAELDPSHGEIKSMRTATHARGRGVGASVLTHLLEEARRRGYSRVSLETGSQDFFAPARRLYERFGFESCPPFAEYTIDPNSAYFCLAMVAPAPHNPARMGWGDVPAEVVATIEDFAGARVTEGAASAVGFSPGFAGRVSFDGAEDLFIKVMSATRDPWSIHLNRAEAAVAAKLPASAPAPSLQWAHDDGEWMVLAFEAINGRTPDAARSPSDRAAVFDALGALANITVPEGSGLPTFADSAGDLLRSWADLATADDHEARMARLGSLRPWVERHLATLVEWEKPAPEHAAGDRLVHADVRTDNMLIDNDHVWLVDWPYASVGAPWLDLASMAASVSVQGGGSAHAFFHAHPLADQTPASAERAIVTALAGYFAGAATKDELPALPGLRAFQRAQALPAIDWLRTLAPELS